MQHRLGRCDACRASYEIPASYLPRFARCRLCRGMVRIGRKGGEEPWRPMPRGAQVARAAELAPTRLDPAREREWLLPRVAATTLAPLTGELAFEAPLDATAWALADVLDGAAPAREGRMADMEAAPGSDVEERAALLDSGVGFG